MKKHTLTGIVAIISVLVAAFMIFAVPAFAADESATVTANKTQVSRGEEVTFTVNVKASGVRAMGAVPKYDANVFEFVSGAVDSTLKIDGMDVAAFQNATQAGLYNFTTEREINANVLTFTLKAKTDATIGTSDVTALISVGGAQVSVTAAQVKVVCAANAHDWSNADCLNAKTCSICNATEGAALGHKWNAATCQAPKTCDRCQLTEGTVGDHSFTKKSDAYPKSQADCENPAVYYYCCKTCGLKGGENNTYTVGTKLGHTGGSATCTEKAVCTRCSTEYGDYKHTFVEEADERHLVSVATCVAKAVYNEFCQDCGLESGDTFEYGEFASHTPAEDWSCDEENHWKECTGEGCTLRIDEAAHAWDDGEVTEAATETKEGKKTFTCSVCSNTKVESIDKLTPSTGNNDNDKDKDNGKNDKKDDDEKEVSPVIIVIGIVAVGVVAALIVIVVIGKKKPAAVAPAAEEAAEEAVEATAEDGEEEELEAETESEEASEEESTKYYDDEDVETKN